MARLRRFRLCMDTFSKQKRSEIMARIKGKDSGMELSLRRALTEANIRYRKNVNRLPGKPDIAFIGKKVVVFLDSCFWHGCKWHGSMPKSNKEFWRQKIRKNKERDSIVTRDYKQMNWTVLRFWEHELKRDTQKVVSLIRTAIEEQ
jgi:DNA mismatch endonuclease, patch repair protein